jgi:HB1, ASXL, restriction endonuclease HTH domain
MGDALDAFAEWIRGLDVAKEPRRVAQAAMLLEDLQESTTRTQRLEAQAIETMESQSSGAAAVHRSLADWAEEVLREAGTPMRYREIAAEIRGRGFRHAQEPKNPDQLADSVWSAMYDDSRKRFAKVGRGIWALTVWASP